MRMALAGVLVALLASTGCQKGGFSGPTGTVVGKITLEGKPVPQGCRVAFISDKGFTASGEAAADGSYKLFNGKELKVPVATYKVAVTPPPPPAMSAAEYDKMMSGGAGPAPKESTAIPEKFQNHATSGLSYDVKTGDNTINIELK